MSNKVQDIYSEIEFSDLLDEAESNAANNWEENFVSDLKSKFNEYGIRMFLSESQQDHLERIANGE